MEKMAWIVPYIPSPSTHQSPFLVLIMQSLIFTLHILSFLTPDGRESDMIRCVSTKGLKARGA